MGMFVRVTFMVAAAIVLFAALLLILKLLVVAALIAAAVVGVAFIVRGLTGRHRPNRWRRVTTLTARR